MRNLLLSFLLLSALLVSAGALSAFSREKPGTGPDTRSFAAPDAVTPARPRTMPAAKSITKHGAKTKPGAKADVEAGTKTSTKIKTETKINTKINSNMKTIVLVHGAWMDVSAWRKVIPILKSEGYEVIAVNLPSHGKDNTPYEKITLQSYVDAVKNAIGTRKNVLLVGHSMGGVIITQTAEQIPSQIGKLVYIGAFLPKNGESMFQLSSSDKDAHLGKFLTQEDPAHNSPIGVKREGVKEAFAEDAPQDDIKSLLANDKPDALAPFVTPMQVTAENFGKISKTYVYTLDDLAIGYALQQSMATGAKIDRFYVLPTSHTPFFAMPQVVAAILAQETNGTPTTDGNTTTGGTVQMQQSSPVQLVDALHTAFGDNHSRAVHAKGIILEGDFMPDPGAASLTTAFHLQGQGSKVLVRFSDFTGIPAIPDNSESANPRGLAIKFIMPDGRTTDIVCHSFDGFPTSTSDEFRELLLAIGASGPEAAKPTVLDKFLEIHPIAKTFLTTQKDPASYATISYFGVNSFSFTNAKGISHYIRYQFIPEGGEQLLSPNDFAKGDADYLQTDIRQRVTAHPVRFKMFAEIAEAGDRIEDPSIAWPVSRRKVLLGVVTISRLSENTGTQDKALSYSPNNIPDGIRTADPMLDFRSKAYPISVKGRQ